MFAVLALAWLGLRYARASAPVRSTQGKVEPTRRGRRLVGVAGLLALPVGTWASGGDEGRVILRNQVDPPFDVGQYPSPLASFRRYVELPKGKKSALNLHDVTLFTIEGVPAGSPRPARRARPLRRRRVGSQQQRAARRRGRHLPTRLQRDRQPGRGHRRRRAGDDRPRLERGLAADRGRPPEPALPVGGPGGLSESFRYNLGTSSAVVPAGVHPGDVYTFTAVSPRDELTPESAPSGNVGAAAEAAGFLDTQAVQWSEGERQPMRRVLAIARHLKSEGKYSDGVIESEKIYHAGHNRYRLTDDTGGVNSPFVVGNDEQYAAWMALLANRIGVPARVVFGAIVPDGGMVTGADVHAWVELQVADGTWRTLPTELFMDDDRPAEQQTTRPQQLSGSVVPPPAPIPPPSTAGEQNDADMKVRKNKSTAKQADQTRRPDR